MAEQKYRNSYDSSYKAPNEVIPKRGEKSRFEFQSRLKNHLIWTSKMRVMVTI